MTLAEWIDQAREKCLDDALAFCQSRGLCATREAMDALAGRWQEFIQRHFDSARPDAFYAQWTGELGAANIPVNIRDQFGRAYVVVALHELFGAPYTFSGRVLDFGCGTAAVSLSWQRTFAPQVRLYLADVDNLPAEFVRYRIEQGGDSSVMFSGVDLEGIADGILDVIVCIDVLEHLPNPSQAFGLLDRKLRPGGVLLLQAPWGGHPEHLESAPIDWQRQGGAQLLETRYRPLFTMVPAFPISGAYWKRLSGLG